MTCDEFRECNAGGVDGILRLTRAERSAVGQHWVTCFECRQWTMTFSFGMTSEQLDAVVATKLEDDRDPEVFRISPENAEKFDLDEDKSTTRKEEPHVD